MSCSARLPIYVVFSQMFFAENALLVTYSMYLLGIAVALSVAFVMKLIDKTESKNNLIIELPEYKVPNAHNVGSYVWDKIRDYLTNAGTVIFVASIIMWALLNCGPHGLVEDMGQSFGAMLGKILVPLFVPIGLGHWQIVVALISGIAAKEVVVSSCGVLFGVNNINSQSGMDDMVGLLAAIGFGPVNAFALMVFCLLYTPCAATLATIKRESGSWKWTGQTIVFQLAVAWVMTFVVYHIGLWFV